MEDNSRKDFQTEIYICLSVTAQSERCVPIVISSWYQGPKCRSSLRPPAGDVSRAWNLMDSHQNPNSMEQMNAPVANMAGTQDRHLKDFRSIIHELQTGLLQILASNAKITAHQHTYTFPNFRPISPSSPDIADRSWFCGRMMNELFFSEREE